MIFKIKMWIVTKLLKFDKNDFIPRRYEAKKGGNKAMSEVWGDLYYENSDSTMPEVSFKYYISEECTCPYHPQKTNKQKRKGRKSK